VYRRRRMARRPSLFPPSVGPLSYHNPHFYRRPQLDLRPHPRLFFLSAYSRKQKISEGKMKKSLFATLVVKAS
jgi:hypothetical protein